MQSKELNLQGVRLFFPTVHADQRGKFFELHRTTTYVTEPFVQDNCSLSKKGVLRGMHFQLDPPQAKLVTVLSGAIFDVVVDVRPSSPTFGKWLSVTLDDKTHAQLYIPAGFAHGFCALSDEALVTYKMSATYDPARELQFRYDDPAVGIEWPLLNPILSERDRCAPLLSEVVSCGS